MKINQSYNKGKIIAGKSSCKDTVKDNSNTIIINLRLLIIIARRSDITSLLTIGQHA